MAMLDGLMRAGGLQRFRGRLLRAIVMSMLLLLSSGMLVTPAFSQDLAAPPAMQAAGSAPEMPAATVAVPNAAVPNAAVPDAAQPARNPLRIGVATMQPGDVFFERFGHDAIVVDDPALGEPVSYNFGFFDMGEPGFFGRFIDNQMQYQLVALPFSQDLQHYRESGRGVSIQWLDLTPEEARTLADRLAVNARPEHARYRYQYFTDNCATRVRDAIDGVLGGDLRPQLEVRSSGNSFASEATRLASPAFWMWLGFDIGLGPTAYAANSAWNDAYVPMRLADGLRQARRDDGRPLVGSEQVLLPHRIAPEPLAREQSALAWLAWGVTLGLAAWALARRAPRTGAAVAMGFWLLVSIPAWLMLFVWFGTAHTYGWANQNLLLFSPLAIVLLPGAWRALRGRNPGRVFIGVLGVLTLGTLAAPFLHWLPVQPQRNGHWIALLLPIHLAMLAIGWRAWRTLPPAAASTLPGDTSATSTAR